MFQVGRFDPKDQVHNRKRHEGKEKKKSKKRRRQLDHKDDDNDTGGVGTTLRVVAPETEGALSSQRKLNTKLSEEAFDDLDLAEDFIQGDVKDDHSDDGVQTESAAIASKQSSRLLSDFDPTDEVQRALYMSKLPIKDAAERFALARFLVDNLIRDGFENFFPIQALVIPDVLIAERYSHMRARDICVSAPTGSGKTLAFVLPILNALATRMIRRLRALVVLPSRDLAKQVYDVFDHYSQGSDLRIGLATGQTDFRAEQKMMVIGDHKGRKSNTGVAHLRHLLDPGSLELALDAFAEETDFGKPKIPLGGLSAIDVLVCTPGRLVDHLDNTPGFTLQHLRFLVVDEADRLLSQSYHGWIPRVLDGVYEATRKASLIDEEANIDKSKFSSTVPDPITWRRDETFPSHNIASVCQPIQLRKLLYSATLTKDPQKLAALKLVNPKHFNAHHLTEEGTAKSSSTLYSVPEQLREYTLECTAEQKPIVLLGLLLERIQEKKEKSIIIVFTSSLQSTHRLARLLQLMWKTGHYGEPPVEFSSTLNQHQRTALMERCNNAKDPVSIVICSDGMSRGMDISSVSVVINYDVPGFAKTYVHRCGRTARAGKEGHAITLLKGAGQVGQFRKLRVLIDNPERVESWKVKTSLVRNAIPIYRSCVSNLQKLVSAEEHGQLRPVDMDIDDWVPGI